MSNANTNALNALSTRDGGQINLTEETLQHLQAHPEALGLLQEAAMMVDLPEGFLLTTVEFDRVIGKDACQPAEDNAEMHFMVRPGRDVPSRVLPGQEAQDTNLFTLIAGRQEDGTWILYTGFVGALAPQEPHDMAFAAEARDSEQFRASVDFWSTHGLCVVADAETFVSTWEQVLVEVDAQRAEA